jgi:hypothetical protein
MRYQTAAAHISFGAFVVAAVVAVTASWGTRLGFWKYETGFEILYPAIAIGAVAALTGAYWLASALRNNDSTGWRMGFAGLIGAIVLLYFPLSEEHRAWGAPPIHDISTDVGNAPQFNALLPLRKGAANGPEYDGQKKVMLKGKITTVAELQKLAYPDIKPVGKLLNPHNDPKVDSKAILFWHAFETAKRMGWHIVAFDEKKGIIEATDTTFWFGFTDDIAIRVIAAGTMGARLDIRSKSRIGTADYGRNAARVMDYLKAVS